MTKLSISHLQKSLLLSNSSVSVLIGKAGPSDNMIGWSFNGTHV